MSELWRILWYRRWTILGVTALLTAVALAYCLLTPPLYTATAQILIDPRDRQVVTNDVNPSTVSPDGGVTQVESQVSVIQSSNVLGRAIAAMDLTHDPEFNAPTTLERLQAMFGGGERAAPRTPADDEARTLAGLGRHLAVKRADKVLVIDVIVTAKNAAKAARLANAIADAYRSDQAEARSDSTEAASKALTASLAAQRQRVETAENAVQRYRAEHNIVVATGQVVSEQQLTEVNNQLATAQNRVSTLRAQIDQLRRQRQSGMADSSSEALQSTVIAKLRETEAALAQRAAYQAAQYGPRYPAVAALAMQLSDVRRLINAELDRIARAATADYAAAVASERALSAKLDSLKHQTLDNDQAAVGLRALDRDLDAVRSVYATFLNRAQETREQSTIDSTNARIITRALPPEQSSWPPLLFLVASGLGGGLGLGAGLALLREFAAPTILSRGQIESLTDAPVIGILAGRRSRPRRRRWRWPGRGRTMGFGTDRGDRQSDAVLGLALRRLSSRNVVPAARGYVRSLLVTSGVSDTPTRQRIVRGFVETAAFRGDRVLLIQADDGYVPRNRSTGLLDVLSGDCPLDGSIRFEALEPASAGPPVAICGPGRAGRRFVEAAAVSFATRLMMDAARDFDVVVIDGGAVTENLKAAVLLNVVDEVVLVAALNQTPQRAVVATVDSLATLGRPVGAVMLVDPMAAA